MMGDMIVSFLVSMELWHLTWGWTQLVINAVIMMILFKIIARYTWIKSFLASLGSHICVSACFIMFVTLLFVYIFGYEFSDNDHDYYLQVYQTPLRCALVFGVWYACLQLLFFWVAQRWTGILFTRRLILIVSISHMISAYILPLYKRIA